MPDSISRNPGSGIPREFARQRSIAIRSLSYFLSLDLPRDPEGSISGRLQIDVELAANAPLPAIDFAPSSSDTACQRQVHRIRVNGREAPYEVGNGHIVVGTDDSAAGPLRIEIEFQAGGTGLHWRSDLVYTLFVPAHAHTVFPCFDQPDLKARLNLELIVPDDWTTLANTPEVARHGQGQRLRIKFAETEPLPCYLYAFAAGRLRRRSVQLDGRRFEILSTSLADAELATNLDEVLELHLKALEFIERYTAIEYPFEQLGFVLIPDFEFGGMEHPGAVLYRQELMLPGAAADKSQIERRAGLIAHETAHMWFGNLVTMRWFDDVWLKEVFANFMADKVLATEFPESDHELGFMLRHFPQAHAIDRTEGTHPVRQPLDNLADAGELYDALIYHKAPIAMRTLERAMGEQALRRGLQRYLSDFRFASAGWPELHERLQRETDIDLTAFSRQWIETAGSPVLAPTDDGEDSLPYGRCRLSQPDRESLLIRLATASSDRRRASHWMLLYEDMLDRGTEPARLLTAGLGILGKQIDELLLTRVIDDLAEVYWRYLDDGSRGFAAGAVERVLWLRARATDKPGLWLDALARLAQTPESLAELESIWREQKLAAGNLSGGLAHRLTLMLALNRPQQVDAYFDHQIARTGNPDLRAKLEFLRPALSPNAGERDALFARLIAGDGRRLWSVAALQLLNHPLRARDARHYLEPGLTYAARLRERGDIFLPRLWLTALFSGHATEDSVAIIRNYLKNEMLPARFRGLILQTADPVFRAARIRC